MKKILLLLGFVLTAIVANAQSFKDAVSGNAPLLKTTSANNTAAPAERVLKAPGKALMHKLSVPKDEKPIFDPEGEDEARQVKIAFSDGSSSSADSLRSRPRRCTRARTAAQRLPSRRSRL